VLYKGELGKRTIGTYRGSTELLIVTPVVLICPRDFLGIFSRRLRYINYKPPRSILGPVPNLWLNYFIVIGKLSRIGVAKANEMANIYLA
jgi:hypothetical protein